MLSRRHCPLFHKGLPFGMRILYCSGVWAYVVGALTTPTFMIIPLLTIWAGIFPIVHGMRAMAMDRGIMATSTAGRIEALVEAGAFTAGFGQELLSALRVFMEYRLRAQLEAVRRGALEQEALVRPGDLSAADRDILRDALRIVRQFREMLRTRYNLAAFG